MINEMKCATCIHAKDDMCKYNFLKGDDPFEVCLVRILPEDREEYVHPIYPNLPRPHRYYKYLMWTPKNKTIDMLLTDRDFEI